MPIPCAVHSSHIIQSFCKDCNKFVCLRCMEGNIHRGHIFTNLRDLLETRQRYLHTTENLEIDLDEQSDAEQRKIVQRAETLQLNIDNLKTKFSDEIKEKVNLQKESLASRKKEYQNEITFLERIIKPSTSPEDEASDIDTNAIYTMSSSPPLNKYFVPSFQYYNKYEVSEVFGSLQGKVLDSGDVGVEGIGEESTNQDDPMPTGLVPVDDEECSPSDKEIDRNFFTLKGKQDGVVRICASAFKNSWITTCGGKEITLYAKDGSDIRTIKTRFKVFDIRIYKRKYLYATKESGRHLLRSSIDTAIFKWTTLMSFPEDTVTYGIDVNDSGQVWICLQNKLFEGKLVRISEALISQEIEFSNEGRRLFKCPTFVHQNNCTDDIMVVDRKNVIVVDKLGRPRFTVSDDNIHTTGKHTDVRPGKFIPLSLENDKEGNMIISDVGNNMIWMFDQTGNLLRSLSERLYGLSGIALHLNEEIWVAISDRKIIFIKL